MPVPYDYPDERTPVQYRSTLPIVLTFVITMLACYVLGQAPRPYYLSESQSIRINVMASSTDEAPGGTDAVQQQQ